MFTLPKGLRRATEVRVMDDAKSYHAHDNYQVVDVKDPTRVYAELKFQTGPLSDVPVNWIFIEDLLHVCLHRLGCFQASETACVENEEAIRMIGLALKALDRRTRSLHPEWFD